MFRHSSVNRSAKDALSPAGKAPRRKWLFDRRGASATEYGLLLVAILLIVAGAFRVLGKNVRQAADKSTGAVSQ